MHTRLSLSLILLDPLGLGSCTNQNSKLLCNRLKVIATSSNCKFGEYVRPRGVISDGGGGGGGEVVVMWVVKESVKFDVGVSN